MVADQASRHATTMLPGTGSGTRPAGPDVGGSGVSSGARNTADEGLASSLTLITGFAVFAAIRRTLAFGEGLVFARYREPTLIAAKTAAALLVFWRPGLAGWLAIAPRLPSSPSPAKPSACCRASWSRAIRSFFLITMGSLMDTSCRTRPAAHRQQADPGTGPRLRFHAVRGRRSLGWPPSAQVAGLGCLPRICSNVSGRCRSIRARRSRRSSLASASGGTARTGQPARARQ